mmetsp:Transcript_30220/g.51418  ORF Transcript_30220/g.51418 Transcript_30220/m.51418 type:complete len:250 (+) Transcript_30220:892-1641(+)
MLLLQTLSAFNLVALCTQFLRDLSPDGENEFLERCNSSRFRLARPPTNKACKPSSPMELSEICNLFSVERLTSSAASILTPSSSIFNSSRSKCSNRQLSDWKSADKDLNPACVINSFPLRCNVVRLWQFFIPATNACSPSSSIALLSRYRTVKLGFFKPSSAIPRATQPFLAILLLPKSNSSNCGCELNAATISTNISSMRLVSSKFRYFRVLCWPSINAILCAHCNPMKLSKVRRLRLLSFSSNGTKL